MHSGGHTKNRSENLPELLSTHSSTQKYQHRVGNRRARPACCSAWINSASDPGASSNGSCIMRCQLSDDHLSFQQDIHQRLVWLLQAHKADVQTRMQDNPGILNSTFSSDREKRRSIWKHCYSIFVCKPLMFCNLWNTDEKPKNIITNFMITSINAAELSAKHWSSNSCHSTALLHFGVRTELLQLTRLKSNKVFIIKIYIS